MPALRCKRRVMHARHDDFHDRAGTALAVLGVIECEFDGIHVRRNDHAAVGSLETNEFRQVIECQMQLCDIAVTPQSPDAIREADFQILDTDKINKGPSGVGRGYNLVGRKPPTITELDARYGQPIGTGIEQHPLNFRTAPYLRSRRHCRCRQGFDQAVDAARRYRVRSPRRFAHAIQHREHGAVRRARRHLRANQAVPAQRGLDEIAGEVLIHEVARRQRDDTQEFVHVVLAEPPQIEPEMSKARQVRNIVTADSRRRFEPERLQRIGQTLHEPAVIAIGLGILGADARQRAAVEDGVLTTRTQTDSGKRTRALIESMLSQFEIVCYFLREMADGMCNAHAKARVKLAIGRKPPR